MPAESTSQPTKKRIPSVASVQDHVKVDVNNHSKGTKGNEEKSNGVTSLSAQQQEHTTTLAPSRQTTAPLSADTPRGDKRVQKSAALKSIERPYSRSIETPDILKTGAREADTANVVWRTMRGSPELLLARSRVSGDDPRSSTSLVVPSVVPVLGSRWEASEASGGACGDDVAVPSPFFSWPLRRGCIGIEVPEVVPRSVVSE